MAHAPRDLMNDMDNNKAIDLQYPVSNEYDQCLATSFLKSLFARCRERKETPDLVIQNSVAAVKKELEQLNAKGITELSYDYLRTMEAATPDVAFRYVVIYQDRRPALFVYFQLFTLSEKNFNLDRDKGFMKGMVSFFLKLKRVRVLISGNAMRTETPAYCYDGSRLNTEEAIAAIAGIAETLAADECATAVILKDISIKTAAMRGMLQRMGFKTPWIDQVMDMQIDPHWKNMEEYIAALSRKYKTRANKILASGKALATRLLTAEEVARYEPEMKQLFAGLVDKQSFTLTAGGANSLAGLKKVYGDDFDVVALFYQGKLAAFYSAFHSYDSYELYYVGFDYELNSELQLYFNILFSGLERAIVLNKQVLKLGRTSFDAKASIGAKARNTDYFIKIANVPDVVVAWFARYFTALEDAKWKLRNPLKGIAI